MLFLNKLLPIFVLPLGWVMLLLVFALVRKKWWPVVLAMLLLLVASLPATGNRLIGWLESFYPALKIAEAGPADAVVVLGGILGPKAAPGYVTNWLESSERYDGGVALLRAGRAKVLVFTGARMPWEKRTTPLEGDDLRAIAISQGVPAERILVTPEISNTREEARAVAEMAKTRGWKKVIVVTTAWHMPRAARLFRQAGVDFIPFPVDYRSDGVRALAAVDFLPKAEALQLTETALRECYGIAFYTVTGR
jgi:uncharacterized SAM-binding protein YcdF (DUF218 family)